MNIMSMKIQEMSYGQLFMVVSDVYCKVLPLDENECSAVMIKSGLIQNFAHNHTNSYPVLEYKELPVFIEDKP